MSIIIDVIVLGIVLAFFFIGRHRGFIKELVSLVSFALALILAALLSGPVATFAYDTFFDKSITDSISTTIEANVDEEVGELMVHIPDEIKDAAKSLGVDIDKIIDNNIGETTEDTALRVAEALSQKVARPIVTNLLRVVLFIILFFVFKILIGFIGKLLDIVSHIPVLDTANAILGGIFGILRGIIVVLLICYVLTLIIEVRPEGLLGITKETVESTYLFNLFTKIVN